METSRLQIGDPQCIRGTGQADQFCWLQMRGVLNEQEASGSHFETSLPHKIEFMERSLKPLARYPKSCISFICPVGFERIVPSYLDVWKASPGRIITA